MKKLYTYCLLVSTIFWSLSVAQNQMDLPVTFDDPTVDYSFIDFGGNTSAFVVDPTNPTNMVVQSTKGVGGPEWSGTTLATPAVGFPPGTLNVDTGLATPIPFSPGNTTMSVRVWSTGPGIPVRLKVERDTDVTMTCETEATTTVTGAWETLVFDFANEATGTAQLNFASTYNEISIFYNFGTLGAGETFYWDDVEFGSATPPPPSLTQMDLPVTFEDPTVNYSTIDFGDVVSTIVADPTNPSNQVVQTVKPAIAQVWGGTTLGVEGVPAGTPNDSGFATAIPFSAGNTTMTVRVWSPASGVVVRLKVENALDATMSVETEATTTVAAAWETLTFDFANEAAGTAALNFASTYDKASIFFNFLVAGTGETYYWDDVEFVSGTPPPPPSSSQMDLPVTFDDPTINYSTIDFGGNSSLFVADPTNPSNMVVQSTKAVGSPEWSGTTLATPGIGFPPGTLNVDTGFATPIPFSPGNTTMSVRVWSTAPGIPVRLKVERDTDVTMTCETEATTTVTGAWETLVFDFSNEATGTAQLNFASTYNKASIFYNFGTLGAGETFYWDDVEFGSATPPPPTLTQMDLPVTFEDPTVNYSTIDFGDVVSTFVVDPTNPANQVVQTVKPAIAQVWGGTTLGVEGVPAGTPNDTGFATAIPFSAGNTTMTVRVWSPASGVVVRLKVENALDATMSVETEATTTVAAAWETLTFDFANEAAGTAALNFASTYDKASIFFNFLVAGTGETYYWDDVEFGAGAPPTLTQMDLPVTFEDPTVNYSTIDFGDVVSTFVVDPTNPANQVVQTVKPAIAQVWGGTTLGVEGVPAGTPNDTGFATAIPFSAGNTTMTVRVWSPASGVVVRLKVENALDATMSVETEATTTVAAAWETLTFDFANEAAGTAALNFASTYDKASIFFNFLVAGTGETYYWDDVEFGAGAPPTLTQMDLPVTFEDPTVNYSTIDFGDVVSTFVVDPTNPANQVVQTVKPAIAQVWGGTTLGVEGVPAGTPNDTGFATAIPFSAGNTTMTVRVWSPASGVVVRLKVENALDATMSVETEATTTVAAAWETLTFDFANEAAGTAALNFASTYDKASIFFNFLVAGTGETYYWDDVEFGAGAPPTLTQMDLPVTFEDPTVNYSTIDFGDVVSTFVVDPTNPANQVVQTVKPAIAQVWGGTTLGVEGVPAGTPNDTGFATAIPFSAGNTTMTVRVWSPASGVVVRLKVENALDATMSVETEATTTVAAAWETLTFDFANEAAGTAALNFASTYDKASIFFNFLVAGTGETYYWDDVEFGAGAPPTLTQMDLPVTFEDPTVNYSTIDFGDVVSTFVVDPTNPANQVVQTVKPAIAQVWGGTTLGVEGVPAGTPNDSGFATAIPFSAGNTTMTVRVWSPASGVVVRLKVENALDATMSVETEATTTVAAAWETLTFDFANEAAGTAALNFASTYDKASIFFNFLVAGTGETYYWDDVEFGAGAPPTLTQMDLPVTFEDPTVNYSTIDFGDVVSTFVVDPTNPANQVVQTVKPAIAQVWGGTTLGVEGVPAGTPNDTGFATAIPFSAGNTTMTVRVWSPASGVVVRLKVENALDATMSVETEATTTVAAAWETLTFDFANEAAGTAALNFASTYDKASIFFNFLVAGTGETYYWDDVEFGAGAPPTLTQMDLPVTFEDPTVNYSTIDFGDVVSTFVVDPTNPANQVVQTVKPAIAQVWGGTTLGVEGVPAGTPNDSGFATAIPFSAGNTTMTVRVWSPASGVVVRLKVENALDATMSVETEATTTVAAAWETLTFDFANEAAGTAALNFASTYDKASIFFNFLVAGTGETYYWDDVEFGAGAPPTLTQMDLPVTFEDPTVNYSTIDFGDVVSTFVVDPTNPANQVVQTVKPAIAQVWGGTTLGVEGVPAGTPNDTGFATAIPFSAGNTTMTVRVWSPASGVVVRLKVENALDATMSVETEATTTVAAAWETLTFDFANEAAGTAALNFASTYDKASIFFNFLVAGTGETYYWDDVEFGAGAPPTLTQMDLPVTFEDPTVNYSTIDFGDVVSTFVVDPTNPANQVVQTVKPAIAQVWGGTTLGVEGVPAGTPNDSGFATAIPFSAGNTTMTVRVWSPASGVVVRLKVENALDATMSVETEATTTVAAAWETLTFDFANEAAGTAALNFASTYDKASIFFNFLVAGTGETYYWDDVEFGAGAPPTLTQMDLPVTFEDPTVNYSTIDFGDVVSTFVVDPTNPANQVVQTVKPAIAQVWGGTTLGVEGVPAGTPNDSGFATAIPFSAGNTTMTVRVWSPASGVVVRLKVENALDATMSVETEATTTVAAAWETLTFDFANEAAGTAALNFASTYDKASIFFNFLVAGTGETYYWDDVQFGGTPPPPSLTQMDLPVTFDDPTVNYSTIDFAGATSSFVVDPTNPSNNVVQTIRADSAAVFAGTTLALPGPAGQVNVDTGFLNPIPFAVGATTMSVRVWSTGPGLQVRLKVEEDSNNSISCETEATTTATNNWETLVFDFSQEVTGTPALNFTNTYDKVTLFYAFGETGTEYTFYWDDVEFGGTATGPCAGVVQDQNILDDFECQGNITYTFANATWTEDVPNPNPTGLNTSSLVGEFIHWGAGTDGAFGGNFDLAPIDLSGTNGQIKIDVHPSASDLPVIIVLQDNTGTDIATATDSTTVSGLWETLSYDFSAIASATDVSRIVLVVSPGDSTQHVVYFDNMRLDTATIVSPCAGVSPDPGILDDFECQGNITYTFANATWTENVINPNPSGLNTSSNVGEFIHWGAGTDGAFGGDLDLAPVDLSNGSGELKMEVHPSATGLPIIAVLQDSNGNDLANQTATTTVSGAWETLTFDMSAAVTSNDVSKVVFLVSPGDSVQHVVYFDNIRIDSASTINPCAGVVPDSSVLDDFNCQGNITYTFANATWTEDVVNPNPSGINTSTRVGEFIHWGAGTDGAFGGDLDLAPIDLAVFGSDLKMDVHPSAVGLPIIVVLQDSNGAELDLQTTTTTVAGAWETLTFDISAAASSNDISQIVFLVSPGDSTQHVVYFDNIRLDTAAVVNPCAGVSPDPSILDDFDCQGNITYTFANATWTEDVVNPNPSGINTSANVGEFIHWGAGTDGAFGGSLDLAPLDLAVLGSELKIDVHPSASGLPVLVVIQDSNGAELDLQTSSTTVSGAWETLSFDISAAASSNDISQIVFLVSPGDTVQHVVYFDNIRLDTATTVNPCAGVSPDPGTFDDFECQGNITYVFANATWTEDVVNPNPSGINTSTRVGEFIHFGAGTDGAFGGSLDLAPIDLAFLGTELKMDVHPSAVGLPITVVLQDAVGGDLGTQTANTTVSGAWETLSYDFSAVTAPVSNIVFVVSPGDTIQHVVYFDNIRLDTSTVIATCPGVAPDVDIMEDFDCQRNVDYTLIDGALAVINNPDTTGINTSEKVGQYFRSNLDTDMITGDFSLAPLDFTNNNLIKMDIWDANPPSVVSITLLDAAGIFLAEATATTSVGDEWEELTFNFETVPFTISVAKMEMNFDPSSAADSNKLYYFDNLRMGGLATGIRDITLGSILGYPNPTSDFYTLSLRELNILEEVNVSIVSMDGKRVFTESISNVQDDLRLDLSDLDQGVYFIELSSIKQTWINRVIKK